MALTQSKNVVPGESLPKFSLASLDGEKIYNNENVVGTNGLLVIFMCNHCPFVKHLLDQLVIVTNEFLKNGINVLAISSNDVENYPEDHPHKMADLVLEKGFKFPYLYDETQDVAKAFGAECTPEFYLYDKAGNLFYGGRFDESSPGKELAPSGSDLKNAAELLIEGSERPTDARPSFGCNIKWKKFN